MFFLPCDLEDPAWMSQEVSNRLGSVGYNPIIHHLYVGEITHWSDLHWSDHFLSGTSKWGSVAPQAVATNRSLQIAPPISQPLAFTNVPMDASWENSPLKKQLEPRKKSQPYFPLNSGWFIGILVMVDYNPYITGQYNTLDNLTNQGFFHCSLEQTLAQWLFLVPLRGGIGGIVHPPIGSIYHLYTTYSPCLLWGYMLPIPPFRGTRNNHWICLPVLLTRAWYDIPATTYY